MGLTLKAEWKRCARMAERGGKLLNKADKLRAEGNRAIKVGQMRWERTVRLKFGDMDISWVWSPVKGNYDSWLENGEKYTS